jgi:hypothetical protein
MTCLRSAAVFVCCFGSVLAGLQLCWACPVAKSKSTKSQMQIIYKFLIQFNFPYCSAENSRWCFFWVCFGQRQTSLAAPFWADGLKRNNFGVHLPIPTFFFEFSTLNREFTSVASLFGALFGCVG